MDQIHQTLDTLAIRLSMAILQDPVLQPPTQADQTIFTVHTPNLIFLDLMEIIHLYGFQNAKSISSFIPCTRLNAFSSIYLDDPTNHWFAAHAENFQQIYWTSFIPKVTLHLEKIRQDDVFF